jgi:hypothetical protein
MGRLHVGALSHISRRKPQGLSTDAGETKGSMKRHVLHWCAAIRAPSTRLTRSFSSPLRRRIAAVSRVGTLVPSPTPT